MGVAERMGDGVCLPVRGCGLKKRAWISNGAILFSIADTEVVPTCLICCGNSWDEETPALERSRRCLHVLSHFLVCCQVLVLLELHQSRRCFRMFVDVRNWSLPRNFPPPSVHLSSLLTLFGSLSKDRQEAIA